MRIHELEAVQYVIEQLVAELGVDSVPSELEVDEALRMIQENIDASQEEATDPSRAYVEDPLVESIPG